MNCSDVVNQLPELLYGELEGQDLQAVERHLADCAACMAEYTSLRRTMELLDRWPAVESNLDVRSMMRRLGSLPGRQQNLPGPWRQTWRPALLGAAATLLLLVSVVGLGANIRFAEGRLAITFPRQPIPNRPETNMSEFVLVLHEDPRKFVDLPPDRLGEVIAEYSGWAADIGQKGHLINGHKLVDDGGRILTRANGEVKVAMGDPLGAAESIGGFFQIKAQSYDQAVEITKTCPHLKYGGRIELRQIQTTAQ